MSCHPLGLGLAAHDLISYGESSLSGGTGASPISGRPISNPTSAALTPQLAV